MLKITKEEAKMLPLAKIAFTKPKNLGQQFAGQKKKTIFKEKSKFDKNFVSSGTQNLFPGVAVAWNQTNQITIEQKRLPTRVS